MENLEELKRYKDTMEKKIEVIESVLTRPDKECCYDKKTLQFVLNTLRREREEND